jgi:hypothetical protein
MDYKPFESLMKPLSLTCIFICLVLLSRAQASQSKSFEENYLDFLDKNFKHFKGYQNTYFDISGSHGFSINPDKSWGETTSLITTLHTKQAYFEDVERSKKWLGYIKTDTLKINNISFAYRIFNSNESYPYYKTGYILNDDYVLVFEMFLSTAKDVKNPLGDYTSYIKRNLKLLEKHRRRHPNFKE